MIQRLLNQFLIYFFFSPLSLSQKKIDKSRSTKKKSDHLKVTNPSQKKNNLVSCHEKPGKEKPFIKKRGKK